MTVPGKFRKIFLRVFLFAGPLILCCATSAIAEENVAMLSTPVPKHRIAVVAVPPNNGVANQPNTVLVKTDAWKTLLANEGVTIGADEWATAVDLTKAALSESDSFRVVEAPNSGNAENEPDLILMARYGVGLNGQRVFLRLVEAKSGTLLTSTDATAGAMREAIENALLKIQNETNLLPWRCHVVGVNGDVIIVDRGYLDGIRSGQALAGVSIDKASTGAGIVSDEQLIMQYGKKVGTYRIFEDGRNFSKAKAVTPSPLLKIGDILEIPEIRLKDRSRISRGKSLWNSVYSKNR